MNNNSKPEKNIIEKIKDLYNKRFYYRSEIRNLFLSTKNAIIVIFVLYIVLNLLIYMKTDKLFTLLPIHNDNTLSALLGAILGGAFTIIGAKISFSNGFKARSNLMRSEKIYEPIYDELIQSKYKLNNTLPTLIKDENINLINTIIYNNVREIMIDSRIFDSRL